MKRHIFLTVVSLALAVAMLGGCSDAKTPTDEKKIKVSTTVADTTEESGRQVAFFDGEGQTMQAEKNSKSTAVFPSPAQMERDGYLFSGWDKSVSEIFQRESVSAVDNGKTVVGNSNQTIKVNPIYTDISDKTNVIATPAVYADKSQAFTVPLYVGGNVELCGIDLRVHYDTSVFQFVRFEENDNVVCNAKDGVLLLNYISTENVKKGFKLCDLVFQSENKKVTDADVTVEIAEIVAIDGNGAFYTPQYETITSVITMY